MTLRDLLIFLIYLTSINSDISRDGGEGKDSSSRHSGHTGSPILRGTNYSGTRSFVTQLSRRPHHAPPTRPLLTLPLVFVLTSAFLPLTFLSSSCCLPLVLLSAFLLLTTRGRNPIQRPPPPIHPSACRLPSHRCGASLDISDFSSSRSLILAK